MTQNPFGEYRKYTTNLPAVVLTIPIVNNELCEYMKSDLFKSVGPCAFEDHLAKSVS